MKKLALIATTILIAVTVTVPAAAVPRLQTYIVDSDYSYGYNSIDRKSWVTNSQEFDLKVVGYWGEAATTATTDAGAYVSYSQLGSPTYDFMDCYLAVSVPWEQSGTVWINGVEINSFYAYADAVPEGTMPAWYLRDMPPAVYGRFNFHSIGRMDNSQANAWHYDHGAINTPGWGDEILMNVVVNGFDWAHFDAIGVDSKGRTHTNSYCHDSSFFATPEPGTLSLLGLGLLGVAPFLRRKRG